MASPLSIYRGQSTTGIGEGPGSPINYGEQYLAADPPLGDDSAALAAIRPWMTLDARTADQLALGERIEGWSCFDHKDWRFVVRLGHAPQYVATDRRAAYFSHGRAWDAAAFGALEGFDPGAHLGRTEAFEPPWPQGGRGEPVPVPAPSLVRVEQVVAEEQAAERLLAHLYQAIVARCPVIMAVPLAEFVAGGPLHALVSFARAALPRELKRDCRIRVFTTSPHQFLVQLAAHLVVVPEAVAPEALQARREATLLNRAGEVAAGREPPSEALAYARSAFQGAKRSGEALLRFADRIGGVRPRLASDLPTGADQKLVQVVFNVQAALCSRDPGGNLGTLLVKHLVKDAATIGTELPSVLREEELALIPEGRLLEVLLGSRELDASPGGRALLALLCRAALALGRTLDNDVAGAWPERLEGWQVDRLALLSRAASGGRSLVSPARLVSWTRRIPLPQVAARMDVAQVLANELAHGGLAHRAGETAAVARSRDDRVLAILAEAVDASSLDVGWALDWVAQAAEEDAVSVGRFVLQGGLRSERWAPVVDKLVQWFRAGHRVPPELGDLLAQTARRARAPGSLARHLDRLELARRAGASELPDLVRELMDVLQSFELAEERRLFVETALRAPWGGAALLVGATRDHTLPPAWEPDVAALLLRDDGVAERLSLEALLRLARWLDAGDEAAWSKASVYVDQSMAQHPRQTTAALVKADVWLLWLQHSQLQPRSPARRAAQMAWLTSTAWQEGARATIEAWGQALQDVGDLAYADVQALASGGPGWPRIPPFLDEQIEDLARAAKDLGVLVVLERAIDPARDLGYAPEQPLLRRMLSASRFGQVPWEALEWLNAGESVSAPPLGAADVRRLCGCAGHLGGKLGRLETAPPEDYLAVLKDWGQSADALEIEPRFAALADAWLQANPRWRASPPNPALAAALRGQNLSHLAEAFAESSPHAQAIEALARPDGYKDPCWAKLAAQVSQLPAGRHPVRDILSAWEAHGAPRPHGPQSFDNWSRVVQLHPELLATVPTRALDEPPDTVSPLPAMQLALTLDDREPGEVGILFVDHVSATPFAEDRTWWLALCNAARLHPGDPRAAARRIYGRALKVLKGVKQGIATDATNEWLGNEHQRVKNDESWKPIG